MGDRTVLTLALVTNPSLPNALTVTLSDEITDRAGVPLSAPASGCRFEVPAWLAYGDGLLASGANVSASLARNTAGQPVAAWRERDYASRYTLRVQPVDGGRVGNAQ